MEELKDLLNKIHVISVATVDKKINHMQEC